MGKSIRTLSLCAALAAPGFAQVFVENAVAAGGASAGAAAGRAVSNGLSGLGSLLGGAAKTGQPKEELSREQKPVKATAGSKAVTPDKGYGAPDPGSTAIAVGSGIYIPPETSREQPAQPHYTPVPVRVPRYVQPRQPRAEDLQRVEPGMSRAEVLAMGAFASRITIPEDDGHLLEVLQYDHATIRVEDGSVVSVNHN